MMRVNRYFFYIVLGIFGWSCSPKNTSNLEGTTIYLVRHAEKDLTDTTDDPPLTAEGYDRAEKLVQELSVVQPDAIYSTRYQRNINTVKPLAEKYGIDIQTYEWHDTENLSKTILKYHPGETTLVCGHGDNLLPLIGHLGAEPPLDSLGEHEYDNIFKVVLGTRRNADVSIRKF